MPPDVSFVMNGAAVLKEQGIIDEIITHAGHCIPTRVGSAGQSLGPI